MRSLPLHRARWILLLWLFAPIILGVAACVQSFRTVEAEQITPTRSTDSVRVRTPVKAHLLDGSTIVFFGGVVVGGDSIRGRGVRHDITLAAGPDRDHAIPIDSVLAMETFRQHPGPATTALFTATAVVASVLLAGVLAVALFGSCPTIYAVPDSGGQSVLQAETFSSSISPLLEGRDVDRLTIQPDELGRVRLEVRNEALETHYINHLALLAVRHAPGETVFPNAEGEPVAVREFVEPVVATDRIGRDLRRELRAADDLVFASDRRAIEQALDGDLEDRIELAIPAPARDSVAVVLTMRSSLLNTVLLYDYMLGRPGAKSLDWLAYDIEEISTAVALGRWMAQRTGMRVSVRDGGQWRQVVRLPDHGPIAWRQVAVSVPVPNGADTLRVRLSFAPDGWRIDQAAFALDVRGAAPVDVPARRVVDRDGNPHVAGLSAVAQPDSAYLETRPGDRFTIEFDAGRPSRDSSTTLLLTSQGYYTEWVRGSWIRSATGEPFRPTDATLVEVVRRWMTVKDSMETQFHASRIPVR